MSWSKHRCRRGTTWHHLSDLGQMLQTPRLWIRAVLSTTHLEWCTVFAKTIKWQTTYEIPDLGITFIRSQAARSLTTIKPNVIMPCCFTVMPIFFLGLFSTFGYFFLQLSIFINYFLLFKGARWILPRERVRLYLFIFICFTIEGEGLEVNVFFSPSLHCTDEKKVAL